MAENKTEARRLWSLIRENDRAVQEELAVCKKQARRTERYNNLLADGNKLKKEFEEASGGRPFNPLSIEDNEKMMARKFLGDGTGKTGPDTVHRLDR